MSVKAVTWVMERSRSKGNDRLVMIAIADDANSDGENAWPGVDTIAYRANVTQRTVQRSIRSLADMGELGVEYQAGGNDEMRDDRRPNRYRILLGHAPARPHPRELRGDDPVTPSLPRGVTPDAATVVKPPKRRGDTSVTPSGSSGVTADPGRGDTTPGHGVTEPAPRGDTGVTQPKTDPGTQDQPAAVPAAAGERPRDLLWDACIAALQLDPDAMTKPERDRANAAVKLIRDAGAQPGDVPRRLAAYRRLFPNATVTLIALAGHWSECDPARVASIQRAPGPPPVETATGPYVCPLGKGCSNGWHTNDAGDAIRCDCMARGAA